MTRSWVMSHNLCVWLSRLKAVYLLMHVHDSKHLNARRELKTAWKWICRLLKGLGWAKRTFHLLKSLAAAPEFPLFWLWFERFLESSLEERWMPKSALHEVEHSTALCWALFSGQNFGNKADSLHKHASGEKSTRTLLPCVYQMSHNINQRADNKADLHRKQD